MSDVLALAGVSVVRGDTTILDDVAWEVEEDERWVVLGPNGAGKTTLLQLAAAQIHPSSGVAGVLGEVLGAVDVFELRPRIGLSSVALADRIPRASWSATSSSPRPTGSWGAGGSATTGSTTSAPPSCSTSSVRATSSTARYGTLSEGERKRVQIARALMTDPELLLLDEPAAGLDLGGREDLVRRLGDLAADLAAPAIVLVSHHVEEIPPDFTHVLLLREGRIVAQGPLEITLTERDLEETFGMPLELEVRGRRYAAGRVEHRRNFTRSPLVGPMTERGGRWTG